MYTFRKAHHSHTSQKAMKNNCCKYIYIYICIYIYIYIKKTNQLYFMWPRWTSKNHIFFHTDIFWNCIPSSVYVCVWKIHVESLRSHRSKMSMMYMYTLLVPMNQRVLNKLNKNHNMRDPCLACWALFGSMHI